MLPMMPLPPALHGNPICKGRATSSANPNHLLDNLLFSHLAALCHNIISYLHHIPDDRQCVRHLSGMVLLYNMLHVHRSGKWNNDASVLVKTQNLAAINCWRLTTVGGFYGIFMCQYDVFEVRRAIFLWSSSSYH